MKVSDLLENVKTIWGSDELVYVGEGEFYGADFSTINTIAGLKRQIDTIPGSYGMIFVGMLKDGKFYIEKRVVEKEENVDE